MQNGVFILDATAAFGTITDVKTTETTKSNFMFYPNPASDLISVNYKTQNNSKVELRNSLGQLIFEKQFNGNVSDYMDVRNYITIILICFYFSPNRICFFSCSKRTNSRS